MSEITTRSTSIRTEDIVHEDLQKRLTKNFDIERDAGVYVDSDEEGESGGNKEGEQTDEDKHIDIPEKYSGIQEKFIVLEGVDKDHEVEPPVDMANFVLTPNDSNDPSYSNLVLPYRVICRQRYQKAWRKMKDQFIKEIGQHELLQSKALDGVRLHRVFCKAVIKPPSPREIITLSEKQKARIEEILARRY